MNNNNQKLESVTDDVLTQFAVDIIKSISRKTKIDPDLFAAAIPGLVHSHWFIADTPVDGCLYCQRCCQRQGTTDRRDAAVQGDDSASPGGLG